MKDRDMTRCESRIFGTTNQTSDTILLVSSSMVKRAFMEINAQDLPDWMGWHRGDTSVSSVEWPLVPLRLYL